MRETKVVIVLAVTTVVLIAIVIGALLLNPLIAVGLPAILLPIAPIIRAIRGGDSDPPRGDGPTDAPPAIGAQQPEAVDEDQHS